MVFSKKLFLIKNESGQSAIEYILLLSVIVTMSMVVYRSTAFKKIFGNESELFETYKRALEFSYRHGYNGREPIIYDDKQRYVKPHKSYLAPANTTRFFYTQKYPGDEA